jgi:hypothetical protein
MKDSQDTLKNVSKMVKMKLITKILEMMPNRTISSKKRSLKMTKYNNKKLKSKRKMEFSKSL